MNKRCVHNTNQMQMRKKINCENKRYLHQNRWVAKCQPKRNGLVLESKEEGWRENSRASRNNVREVWRVGWWPWDNTAGKSSHTHKSNNFWGYQGSPVSLEYSKSDLRPSPMTKYNCINLHCAIKRGPTHHLIRGSPTQRGIWDWDLPMWFGGFWVFTQRQQQNIYKESKQTHRGGEAEA